MTSRRAPANRVDPRSRQAQVYFGEDQPPEPNHSEYQPRPRAVTLPTLKSVYGGRPVSYENGRLMVGGNVVPVRKGDGGRS